MSGVLPRFVTPSDVRDLKVRVDPYVRAMDQSIPSCASASADVKTSWATFSSSWRAFFNEDDSWLHTAAQMDQAEAYEVDVSHWQTWLTQQRCATGAPTIQPSSSGTKSEQQWTGTIRTVAIAGAVIAAALGIRAVTK
jgi:hypothetical protein